MDNLIYKIVADKYTDLILTPYDILYPELGFDGINTLSRHFGGQQIYVPRTRSIYWECICQQIIDDYNGRNIGDLCRQYNVSAKTIRNLLKNKKH
jgi:Mor family transcriptional regulator